MGIPSTSAMVCITYGDLRDMPPTAMISLTGTPSDRNLSFIALEPKAVASTRDLNTMAGVVPSVRPEIRPFTLGSASGVRLPFIQSRETGSSAERGSMEARCVSSGIPFPVNLENQA